MLSITKLFLAVLRAFVTNTAIDQAIKPEFTPEVNEKLLNMSKAHDVVQIVSDVLFKNGLLPKGDPLTAQFQKYQVFALRRYMNIEREHQMIYKLFEDNAIPFVPLKGSVIRQYYAEPYMRTSKDIDILVRMEDLERAADALVSNLNYDRREGMTFHDVHLFSQSGVMLELHYSLIENQENLDRVLLKVWDYCVDTEKGKYYKLQTPEFYLFHHVSHMVNHFLRGGCGIRSFIDLYLIEKHLQYDAAKAEALMEESEIAEFYHAAKQCIASWFDGAEATEIVNLMEDFILKGGIFGTKENRINIDQNKQGGKSKYYLSRIFIPYDKLKYKYTILQKHKYLLPLMWVVRLFSLISPETRQHAKTELDLQHGISETAEKSANRMLNLLKL